MSSILDSKIGKSELDKYQNLFTKLKCRKPETPTLNHDVLEEDIAIGDKEDDDKVKILKNERTQLRTVHPFVK